MGILKKSFEGTRTDIRSFERAQMEHDGFVVPTQILVVDDDAISARFVSSLLCENDYDVVVAADGVQALDLVRRHEFALVVCDLVMPYRDGYSVLRALRGSEEFRDLPVLLLSMRDREEDIVRGLEEGADDYVIKPFNARELMARIRKILNSKRKAS